MEEKISYEGREYTGVSFQLGNVPLLIIRAKKGYVACTYVSKEAAEKFALPTNVVGIELLKHLSGDITV